MKCSLKDGFINILLLICITPTEGIEFPLFLHKSSVLDKPMNLQQFRASINRLQDLDSFPDNGDNQLHRIVKKQMATCDYKDARKSKRSVAELPGRPLGFRCGAGDGADVKCKDDEKAENADKDLEVLKSRSADSTDSAGSFLRKLKEFAREKDLLFTKRAKKNDPPNRLQQIAQLKQGAMKKEKDVEEMLKRLKDKLTGKEPLKEERPEKDEPNSYLAKQYTRFPDKYDYRCYYECESHPNGCLKLKHKRCPQGQFFSFKYLKCLKVPNHRRKKSTDSPGTKKIDLPETGPEDPEPANEWLDATQGSSQKIPSEFKPKKKPGLKIYHLRTKRKLDGTLRGEITENRHLWGGVRAPVHGMKKHGTRHHLPRSYVIRINKKEDQITENDENENDNDEEDEETEEEDEDEEADDEEDESEEEETKEVAQEKPSARESFRDLLKSAKAAVTNRARFEDPLEMAAGRGVSPSKTTSSLKSKKSNDSTTKEGKKVLIDASIKVDSTISSVLKNLLKSKRKDKEASSGLADEYETLAGLRSRDQMGPEGTALYEHLMEHNPRVKRYYLANCAERGN